MKLRTVIMSVIAMLAFVSCGDTDVDGFYAAERAWLKYDRVFTAAPLHSALSNPGMFCSIVVSNGCFVFKGSDGQTCPSDPLTELDNRVRPKYVAGFVVGIPAVPDMQTGSAPVAYDLACPNCNADNALTRRLSFATTTTMTCSRCHRTYDLNNGGHVSSEAGGRKMLRYHITYNAAAGIVQITNP